MIALPLPLTPPTPHPSPLTLPTPIPVHRNRQVTQRAEESIEALEMLKSLNAGQFGDSVVKPFDKEDAFSLDSLRDRLLTDKDVVICGHSFGGGAVVKALDLDDQQEVVKREEKTSIKRARENYY